MPESLLLDATRETPTAVQTPPTPPGIRGGEQTSGGIVAPPDDFLRMGYLGPRIDHCDNIVGLFDAAGSRLPVLVDSASWGVADQVPRALAWTPTAAVWRKAARLHSQLCGTHHAGYVQSLLEQIDREKPDCLLAYWGTWVLGDILAVKRHRPGVKVILNVLCHPFGLSRAKVAVQNWQFRRSAGCLDGIIASSQVMKSYLEREVLRGRDVPLLVWPPYYSERFFPATRLPACEAVPNVLFLGRMDWRRSQPSDNVCPFIQQLLDHGIHVHHHDAPESSTPHPHRHLFRYMPLAQAEVYATQCDASLILYNLDACGRSDRFDVTVPDRLVASVAAGIPVAIPAHGYAACKEYLRDYGAVIEFTSAAGLARQLSDRPAMEQLRTLARVNSRKYIGERRLEPLLEFVRQVVER